MTKKAVVVKDQEELSLMEGGLPDCKKCFWLKGDMCCYPFGEECWKASEVNNVKEVVNFLGEPYLRSDCEHFTTPTIGRKILEGTLMKCSDCIHYEKVRGFHICFVKDLPGDCDGFGGAEFSKENPDRKPSKRYIDYWNVCFGYREVAD